MSTERDYVLGTHAEELARLGLQHRVWRPAVLQCWQRAGLTVGSRVLDVGAGPGYASVDLAEIVGTQGRVTAVERSSRFVEAGRQACAIRGLENVHFHELDLMHDSLPQSEFDVSWCRWVASFVSSPRLLIEKVAGSVRVGGVALFHEYLDYASWRYAPALPLVAEFTQHVMASWRESGGEPDIAPTLLPLLVEYGFQVREAKPLIFSARPRDHFWQWPASFLNTNLERLRDLGRVDDGWIKAVRKEFQDAERDPDTLMITPTVLEIVAERIG
jgi:SAM-dependent methyltransferase